ncbi:MAG TPA: gluconate 2-dehydrogenase subunit 3 family protein [Gemmatimonadaceae bacterium]|nr:gluconate 2-dehydrogenase subunit 3 family protein [Gemmatimonadaceae bacterium]
MATTLLLGGTLVASTGIFAACRPGERQERRQALGLEDEHLIEEVADTILPTTASSPGAKAAGAGAEINLLLSDCYDRDAQQRVVQGLGELRAGSEARFGRPFTALAPDQRTQLLSAIAADSRDRADHWFPIVRELSLRAYFSSEIGMTKALRYIPVPGRWVGCVPLQPGQPAWA